MTFGERLTELRIEHGYNKRNELADKLGIPSTTLRNYETDAREPGHTFLKKISEFFNVSVDYLLCLTNEKERALPYQLKSSEYEHIKKYRDLDNYGKKHIDYELDREVQRTQSLAELQQQISAQSTQIVTLEDTRPYYISYYQRMTSAGNGEYLFDDIPTDLICVKDTSIARQADFVLGVNGDSMEPTYHDGDKVFVEKTDMVQIGDIGIFFIGNECFIKEAGENGLISHNPKYKIIPGTESIRCVGHVLGKVEN